MGAPSGGGQDIQAQAATKVSELVQLFKADTAKVGPIVFAFSDAIQKLKQGGSAPAAPTSQQPAPPPTGAPAPALQRPPTMAASRMAMA